MFIIEKHNHNYHWTLIADDNLVIARCINEGYPTKSACKASMQKVRDAIIYGNVKIHDLTNEE